MATKKVAPVLFKSKARMFKVLLGYDAEGRPVFCEFFKHELTTGDPVVIEALLAYNKAKPYEVWVEGNPSICPVCYKLVATEFALNSHLKTHTKAEIAVVTEEGDEDEEPDEDESGGDSEEE